MKAANETGGLVEKIQKIADVSDSMMMSTAHLNSVNDGSQSTDELESKIFASSQRSRSGYQSNLDMVSNLGQTGAFESNDEEIAFAEDLNKVYATAGLSQEQIGVSSSAITDALSSGTINAAQLNSILETTPEIFSNLAEYLDVPSEKLMEMASNGQISSDMLKNSVLESTGEIDSKFSDLPVSINDCWAQTIDKLLFASQPLLELINVLAQNWSILEPIIIAAAVALAMYNAALLVNGASMLLSAITTGVSTAFNSGWTAAVFAQTLAQEGLNAALLSCPIVWIILFIILLISLFYLGVAAINKFAGTSLSATGLIAGAFMVALAFVGNKFIQFYNLVIGIIAFIWNWIAEFAEFFANVFDDPLGSVVRLFWKMGDYILGILEKLASGIDKLFGTHLADRIAGLRESLKEKIIAWVGEPKVKIPRIDADSMYMDEIDYKKAFDNGYKFGEGIDSKFNQLKSDNPLNPENIMKPEKLGKEDQILNNVSNPLDNSVGKEQMMNNIGETAQNTGDMSDQISSTSEDLTYLRDLAEQETINNFTTAEIKVEMRNNMRVNKNMDLDGIVNYLEEKVSETMSTTAEGVY